jgi:hypothetical protein
VADYSKNEAIREKFIRYRNKYEYNGYIPADKFADFRKRKLNI